MAPSEKTIEACARAAHEANRAYCITLGDLSQPAWDDAPEWQKTSARNGVVGALAGHTPEQSHEGWMAEKAATGWRWGPVKDPEKKEHPCFVSYDALPATQRHKDLIFVSVVRAVGAALDPVAEPVVEAVTAELAAVVVAANPEPGISGGADATLEAASATASVSELGPATARRRRTTPRGTES